MQEKYRSLFAKLHTDTSSKYWGPITRHKAPHKPFLLLSVIDLFAQNAFQTNLIELTPELTETFALYWAKIMLPKHRGNIALPFFHLKSESFWHLAFTPDGYQILLRKGRLRSVAELNEAVIGARLDEELYTLLQDAKARTVLRTVLVENYFASEIRPTICLR